MNPLLPDISVLSGLRIAKIRTVSGEESPAPDPVNRKYREAETKRAWSAANRERLRVYARDYYQRNKERIRARARDYYRKNHARRRAYLNAKQREYRAKK